MIDLQSVATRAWDCCKIAQVSDVAALEEMREDLIKLKSRDVEV